MAATLSPSDRVLVDTLCHQFLSLQERNCVLVRRAGNLLYKLLPEHDSKRWSAVGENVLRSAAAVEQTCGGLLSNLWDDPFEWTLAETLSTSEDVLAYLGEVESTRQKSFSLILTDADLLKSVSLPSEHLQPLVSVLLETLIRAVTYQGRAAAYLELLTTRGQARGIISSQFHAKS